jgi:hypothetical protein
MRSLTKVHLYKLITLHTGFLQRIDFVLFVRTATYTRSEHYCDSSALWFLAHSITSTYDAGNTIKDFFIFFENWPKSTEVSVIWWFRETMQRDNYQRSLDGN